MVRTLSRIGEYSQKYTVAEAKNLAKRSAYFNHQECSHGILLRSSRMHPTPPPALRMLLGPRSGSPGLPLQHSTFRCLPVALGEEDRLLGPFYP